MDLRLDQTPVVAAFAESPLSYRRWKRLLANASTASGVELTSHSFRHFAASALISGGASVKQVQTFLGHASAVITLRTYAHMWPRRRGPDPERARRRSVAPGQSIGQ